MFTSYSHTCLPEDIYQTHVQQNLLETMLDLEPDRPYALRVMPAAPSDRMR